MKLTKKYLFFFFCIATFSICYAETKDSLFFYNPIIDKSLPDPSVIRAKDGYFYLYATEDTRNLPIYKSKDLLNWEFVGTAFSKDTHPNFFQEGMIWAPDINYIKGMYVLYYSLSKGGERINNGIGVAVSSKPEGPFTDKGKLFTSKEIGVNNSIDQFYFKEKGHSYLFWGSFDGIYCIEMAKEGISIKPKASKRQIAGSFMEATAIEKKNGYYYLFGSSGNCCNGKDSNYHIIYGRSKKLFGPYLNKEGKPLLENNYEILVVGNGKVAGPGHQSRLIKDDKGQDWLIYHGYLRDCPQKGRQVFMDKLIWKDGWPLILNGEPSSESECPYFK